MSVSVRVPTEPLHRPALGIVLCLLTVFGPISMDLYLPVLPALTTDLGTTTSGAQLTVTACLLGLALGQVVAGPVSDRFGRRRPLLVGVAAYVVASVLCALAPTIETLVAARLLQGLAGAVGIVIAQAAGRDLFTGARLLRYYGGLTVLAGLAAIVGPVVGGQLAKVTDWRGTFVFLAALGVVILAAGAAVLRETLPPLRRRTGGLTESIHGFRRLLADPVFLGATLVTGFANAAVFAYLSGATFVLQDGYGLSPQGYSLAFGLNSLGFMVLGYVAGRTSAGLSVHGTLVAGLAMVVAGAAGVLVTGVLQLPLPAIVISLLVMVSGVAVTTPPSTALALEHHADVAGTASSLLGLARFGFGAVAAPLVGVVGSATAASLGAVALVAAACAVGGCTLTRRPARARA
ncbi:multidrug effflux MFS transporter [Nocardioides sp. MAHUQ-72]|uniref:multidrug effflux MFS transporter n=1 Tax=unclassified Nocardioides TaxID=2615069 RepID=UPI003607F3FA